MTNLPVSAKTSRHVGAVPSWCKAVSSTLTTIVLLLVVAVTIPDLAHATSEDRRILDKKTQIKRFASDDSAITTGAKKGAQTKAAKVVQKNSAKKGTVKKGVVKKTNFKKTIPSKKQNTVARANTALKKDRFVKVGAVYKKESGVAPAAFIDTPFEMHGSEVSNGQVQLKQAPALNGVVDGKIVGSDNKGNQYTFTVNPELQNFARGLVRDAQAHHVAVVAMDVRTGKILAFAGRSPTISDPELHDGYPAASLFKVITSAAALERSSVRPDDMIAFRGGTYALDRANYSPDSRRDNRSFSLADALGKSCNPVFGRVALKYLTPDILRSYTDKFGFNQTLSSDFVLDKSHANIPTEDYEFSRTGAGFGDVTLSPLHASAIVAGIANGGVMMRPYIVESVKNSQGAVIERGAPQILRTMVSAKTSQTLLGMMEHTTTIGTSRKQFYPNAKSALNGIRVAGKTGTLNGMNPQGLTNWFIGTAPIENPRIAIAALVVDPGGISGKASYIARRMFQKALLQ